MGAAFLLSLEVIFPLLALASAGWLYARFIGADMTAANQVNMNVFLPALVFLALARAGGDFDSLGKVAAMGAFVVLGSGAVAFAVCRRVGAPVRVVVPPMMFTNYGNIGLPLIPAAMGEGALSAAAILFIVGNTLHVTLGFKIMRGDLSLRFLFSNPMFGAAAAGLLFGGAGWDAHSEWLRPVEMMGAASIPLMLFALGAKIADAKFSGGRTALWGAALCPASGLICFAVAVPLFSPTREEAKILALFAALPPALLNYMFAEKFNANPEVSASIVLAGNLAAAGVLPLVLTAIFLW